MGKLVALINYPSINSIFLRPGKYKFECWGAQGGTGLTNSFKIYEGGRGSYVSGILELKNESTFYLYVGGKGEDGNITKRAIGGFNGGGNGGIDEDDDNAGSGGGSTDIRIHFGQWNNYTSLLSRIMVASGGSGSVFACHGAPGGSLHGYKVTKDNKKEYEKADVNQTNGFYFGVGQNGVDHKSTPASGAGGGYYGGLSGVGTTLPNYPAVSSSGSSFVSGYEGCNAIDESGIHTNTPVHFSNYVFQDIVMRSGNESFPSPFGRREIGHTDHGAIKISHYPGSDPIFSCKLHRYSRPSFTKLYQNDDFKLL